MATQRLPLPQILAPRNDFYFTAKDSLLKNCYREKNPLGEIIVKRPGLEIQTQYSPGIAQGAIRYGDNALFVLGDAVAGAPNAITGTSWSSITAPTKPSNGSSAGTAKPGSFASMGGNLYAIGGRDNSDTTISVYRSTDNGINWSTISTPWISTSAPLGQCAIAYSGSLYAWVTGANAYQAIYKSADGITWALVNNSFYGAAALYIATLTFGGYLYAAVVKNSTAIEVLRTTDGITWTSVGTLPSATIDKRYFGFVCDDTNLYVIGGEISSVADGAVYRSSDGGFNWVVANTSANFGTFTRGACWYADGKFWISNGSGTSGSTSVWYSLDCTVWTQATATSGISARQYPAYCVHNSTMYIGPGINSSAIVNTSYKANIATPGALTPSPPVPNQKFQMTLIPATSSIPVKVFLKNNNVAYVYDGTTFTYISDADYPRETVYGVAYLDGTIYVMDKYGNIWGSDINAPTSWTATNVIVANSQADEALALARQLNYLVAFKQYTIEFFYDAGNATGSPLGKVLNAVLAMGLASVGSIAQADNTIYFMATTQQHGRTIQKLDGYTPTYISNPYIDRILNSADLSAINSFVVKSNGHFFYVLSLANISFVYDETTQDWHLWSGMFEFPAVEVSSAAVQSDGSILITVDGGAHTRTDGSPVDISGMQPAQANGRFNLRYDSETMATNQFSYVPETPVTSSELQYSGAQVVFFYEDNFSGIVYCKGVDGDLLLDATSGAVYNFNNLIYEDNGNPINVTIQTALLDFSVMNTKRYSRFELVGDKVDTNVYVRYSDDDYQNWSLYRSINMNVRRAKISNLGSGRRRAFSIKHTDDSELRLLAAEVDYEIGAF